MIPMRTLILTSPHMRGHDVLAAQHLLNRKGFDAGKEDGEFGTATAAACKRAKWAVGYPRRFVHPSYGPKLNSYLLGLKRPPAYWRWLAKQRAAQEALASTRVEKVLHAAIKEAGGNGSLEGVKESPAGSNEVKYDRWYGFIGPWCAAFVSWVITVGANFRGKFHWAYCPYVVSAAREHRYGLSIVSTPPTGTNVLVCALFDWDSDWEADHIGFVLPAAFLSKHYPATLTRANERWGTLSEGEFWTVEGNTSPTNNSNGGAVWVRKRDRSDVQALVKVAL